MPTSNDAILWYNVGDFAQHGLAVPNYGNDGQSQNTAILDLTAVVARQMQVIMFGPDARSTVPPRITTLAKLHQMCIRMRKILASRAVPANVPQLESQHALPAPEDFRIFPVPFFTVRNPWLRRYCQLMLIALTDAYQHTENANSLDFSTVFAAQIGQYPNRIYQQMAIELFGVPDVEAKAPGFTLTEVHFGAYAPEKVVSSSELIDTVPDLRNWLTEDSAAAVTCGIPTSHLPELGPWPGGSSSGGNKNVAATAVKSEAFPTVTLPV